LPIAAVGPGTSQEHLDGTLTGRYRNW
jgi:hypothetical protein